MAIIVRPRWRDVPVEHRAWPDDPAWHRTTGCEAAALSDDPFHPGHKKKYYPCRSPVAKGHDLCFVHGGPTPAGARLYEPLPAPLSPHPAIFRRIIAAYEAIFGTDQAFDQLPERQFVRATIALDAAIGSLANERQRCVLRAWLIDGYSMTSIAHHYGVSMTAIRNIVDKALRLLRHPARSRPLFALVTDPTIYHERIQRWKR